MTRFSKENLLNELQSQIAKMEKMWGFVSTNGTNQIKDKSDFDLFYLTHANVATFV